MGDLCALVRARRGIRQRAERLRQLATAEAKRLGIFGAATFVTRGEIFWGDDRLEDAVRCSGTLLRR